MRSKESLSQVTPYWYSVIGFSKYLMNHTYIFFSEIFGQRNELICGCGSRPSRLPHPQLFCTVLVIIIPSLWLLNFVLSSRNSGFWMCRLTLVRGVLYLADCRILCSSVRSFRNIRNLGALRNLAWTLVIRVRQTVHLLVLSLLFWEWMYPISAKTLTPQANNRRNEEKTAHHRTQSPR